MSRNAYMLQGKLATRGYDWWWHSLVGVSKSSGLQRPFFIEYFAINPALGGKEPILGQLEENKRQGIRPSYAMLMAGSWSQNEAVQIHNYYGITDFTASVDKMDVRIGDNFATETHIKGAVKLSQTQATEHPEFMSDAGEMSWDLEAKKVLSYSVGCGASELARSLNAFQMYWHIQGMKTLYNGTIIFNGEEFAVTPETSYGYQDKNWGTDYTNPWVWLNCNNFTCRTTKKKLALTSLDVGGAKAVFFGVPLQRSVLVVFYHEERLYEFNFSKIWQSPRQKFRCEVTEKEVIWDIVAWNKQAKIEIYFTCAKDTMLFINYENPDGEKKHNQLWNGGYAAGTVKLYQRTGKDFELIDIFDGELGGCEYGVY
ncbi:tocopherol cyclase family protein [Fischerella sp. PCC 9605]|uniref:tocopherol cyclase family protein n=1 Tax=Fischerella sp. PCC 9605 TaxID=1173024 RepID=UPI00047E4447|nr:tocopherol cyclase family protein [Fischerella sp. PCC 9605]